MVKFVEVKLEKKDLFLFLILIMVLTIVGVMAYSATFSGGDPVASGHSSNEINVNDGGTIKTLQQWITEKGASSGGGSVLIEEKTQESTACSPGIPCTSTVSCSSGMRVVGGGCYFYSQNTEFKKGHPLDSNGDNKWDQYVCSQEGTAISGSVRTTAYVTCTS